MQILASHKFFKLGKNKDPWINSKLKLLRQNRRATERRYIISRNVALLTEPIRQLDYFTENPRSSFLHNRLNDALTNQQDVWRERGIRDY